MSTDNLLKFGLAAGAGYFITSILFLPYSGFQGYPNEEIGTTTMMIRGGVGPVQHGGLNPRNSGGGGGGSFPGSNWQKTTWQRAYGNDAAGFPMSPEENMSSYHPSLCSPEALDCGMSLSCLYHKSMCSLGVWK